MHAPRSGIIPTIQPCSYLAGFRNIRVSDVKDSSNTDPEGSLHSFPLLGIFWLFGRYSMAAVGVDQPLASTDEHLEAP